MIQQPKLHTKIAYRKCIQIYLEGTVYRACGDNYKYGGVTRRS